MKIKTKLQLSVLAAILVTALIVNILYSTNRRTAELIGYSSRVQQIVMETFEMNIVARDYLLYREDRARTQWILKFENLNDLTATDFFSDPAKNAILDEIRGKLSDMGVIFAELSSIKSFDGTPTSQMSLERLETRLLINSQDIVSRAMQLSDRVTVEQQEEFRRTNFLILLLVVALALMIILILFIFQRTIKIQLNNLRRAIDEVTAGKFDQKVFYRADDEIGQLANSFNKMIDRLKMTYTELSKKNEELEEKSNELQKINRLMVERELKMAELKKKLPKNEL